MKNFVVPKPCHEDWGNMLPDEKGKFCSSCAKSVYDFTQHSEEKIQKIYEESSGSICGRFLPEQLQDFSRAIKMTEISSFPYIRRSSVLTFAASAAALLFALSSCTKKQDSKFTLKENKKDSIKINATLNSVNTQVLGMMLPVKDTVKEYSKNIIKTAIPPTAAVPVPDHPDYFVTGEPVYMPPDSIQQK